MDKVLDDKNFRYPRLNKSYEQIISNFRSLFLAGEKVGEKTMNFYTIRRSFVVNQNYYIIVFKFLAANLN